MRVSKQNLGSRVKEEYGQDEFGEVMDLVMGLWMRHPRKRHPEQDIADVPKANKKKSRLGLNHHRAYQDTKQRLEVSCASKNENMKLRVQ